MQKVLITGGAGFSGGYLSRALVERGDAYVVIADMLQGDAPKWLPDASKRNWELTEVDVNDWSEIAPFMRRHKFDAVFHYSAFVGVEQNLRYPTRVFDDLKGVENLVKLSLETGVDRILYASSSEVYGNSPSFPQYEQDTPLNARLPYAAVKNAGEAMLRSYQQEFGLDYTIFRFFNLYGAGQRPVFVISQFLSAALENRNLRIYGDGSQKRTFCYVEDATEAVIKAWQSDDAKNQTLNVGNDQERSILELAQLIIQHTQSSSQIIHETAIRQDEIRRRLPHIQKMRELLGRELTSLPEGLNKMMENLKVYNPYGMQV